MYTGSEAQDELSENNCLRINGVEHIRDSNETELRMKTDFLDILFNDIETLRQINENIGGIIRGTETGNQFCSGSLQLTLQYSRPFKLENMANLLSHEDSLILDFFAVFTDKNSYCILSGVILGQADCETQMEGLANLTTFIAPEFPERKIAKYLFQSLNAKVTPLFLSNGKLGFEHETLICGHDIFYNDMRHLKSKLSEPIIQSTKLIFNFLLPISSMDYRSSELMVNSEEIFTLWQECSDFHAPAILRAFHLLNDNSYKEWYFPKIKLDVTSPDSNISPALASYVQLLKVVCKQKTRRSVLSFLFGSDDQVKKLERSSVATHNSFEIVRRNEATILDNQRLLASATGHIQKNEANLLKSFNTANRRLLQLTYDLALTVNHESQVSLHEKIRSEYNQAILQAEIQLSSVRRDLEDLLRADQMCRLIDSARGFYCPSERPSFHIADDLIVSFMAARIKSRKTSIFHCLPMQQTDNGQLMRFKANANHFRSNESIYHGSSFDFPLTCLKNPKSCRNLYENLNPNTTTLDFGPCYVINNHLFIYLFCIRHTTIKTESGLIFKIKKNNVERISLDQIPLYTEGERFSHEDLYIRENHIRQRTMSVSKDENIEIGGQLYTDEGKLLNGKVSIKEDMRKFFSPESVRGSHIMAGVSAIFGFVATFLLLSILMRIPCVRQVIIAIADTACRCCGAKPRDLSTGQTAGLSPNQNLESSPMLPDIQPGPSGLQPPPLVTQPGPGGQQPPGGYNNMMQAPAYPVLQAPSDRPLQQQQQQPADGLQLSLQTQSVAYKNSTAPPILPALRGGIKLGN